MTMSNKLRSISGSQRFWICVQLSIVILCIIRPEESLNNWLWITGYTNEPPQGIGLLIMTYLIYCAAGIVILSESPNISFGSKLQLTLFNIVIPVWHFIKLIFRVIYIILKFLYENIGKFNSYLNKNM